MSVDLDVFRTAKNVMWKRWTVFAPHRGDDGTLIADGVHRLPLDTYTPDTLRDHRSRITDSGVGIVVVDPATLGDTHSAIRAWCRELLDRDDIEFDA